MCDIGRVTCAPLLKLWEGHPLLAFNPFRDLSQAGPPVSPFQKLGGARVLSFHRSSLAGMPDGSPISHKGEGEGGDGGGGLIMCPPTFKSVGAHVGLCPPPPFWAEQMF